jgi:DNA-binding transcriptional regulator YiaG
MVRKYQSEILGVIHQEAEALHAAGVIDDTKMREYDQDCLVPPAKPAPKPSKTSGASPQKDPAAAYASPTKG